MRDLWTRVSRIHLAVYYFPFWKIPDFIDGVDKKWQNNRILVETIAKSLRKGTMGEI